MFTIQRLPRKTVIFQEKQLCLRTFLKNDYFDLWRNHHCRKAVHLSLLLRATGMRILHREQKSATKHLTGKSAQVVWGHVWGQVLSADSNFLV